MSKFIGSYIDTKRKAALNRVEEWQGVLYSGVVFGATLVVMFWASVFLYTSFYFTYMPQESVAWPVHFRYDSCVDIPGICSNPTAVVSVTDPVRGSLLARGQKYRVVVDIEMPESPTNQRLGMFLVDIGMKSHNGDMLRRSSRSAMLRYRSPLLQTVATALFAPLLLYGVNEEKQMVTVELFSQYEEDPVTPLSEVHVELVTRHVELYAAQLRIHAMFTGLRYFMYHYPLTAATVGIGICMVFLSAVVILSWYQFSGADLNNQIGRKRSTFPNGQVLTGPSEDMRTASTLAPVEAVSRRRSSARKDQEKYIDAGKGKDLDDFSTDADLRNSDKNEDSNQLPEAERRDSDEFEVVNSTKMDHEEVGRRSRRSSSIGRDEEVGRRSRRSSSIGRDEGGVVRQRVQSIHTGETLLDE